MKRIPLSLLALAVLQPLSASQQTSSRQPAMPSGTEAEPIRWWGGVPRDSLILGETPGAPPGYTATGWTLKVSTDVTPSTAMPSLPSPRTDAVAVEANGRIYVIGGRRYIPFLPSQGAGTPAVAVDEYDPVAATWTTKQAPIPTIRIRHTSAAVNGRIYMMGGQTGADLVQTTGAVDEYDTVLDTWQPRSPLPTPRRSHSAVVIGETIYVLGGESDGPGSLASVDAYDPLSDSWQARAPMPRARSGFAAVAHQGKIYAFSPTIDVYDPVSDSWTTVPAMPNASGWWGMSANEKILLVTSAILDYDPTTHVVTTVGQFLTPRGGALACLGNKIFSLGGGDPIGGGGGSTAVCEQFDLASSRTLYVHRKN